MQVRALFSWLNLPGLGQAIPISNYAFAVPYVAATGIPDVKALLTYESW